MHRVVFGKKQFVFAVPVRVDTDFILFELIFEIEAEIKFVFRHFGKWSESVFFLINSSLLYLSKKSLVMISASQIRF